MKAYKSGLSYEKLSQAAKAGALDTLGTGGYRKNGRKYQGTVSYIDRSGEKPKHVNLTHTFPDTSAAPTNRGGTTKTEMKAKVQAWVAQVRKDIQAVSRLSTDPTVSVREAVQNLIDGKVKKDAEGNMIGCRLSTETFYRSCAKRLEMSPTLASMPVIEVRDVDVQAWVDEMAKTLAKKTIKDSLNLLSQMFVKVLGDASNPCASVEIPKNTRRAKKGRTSTKPNALNAAGVAALNTYLDKREEDNGGPDAFVVGVRLGLHTGLRAEETTGLRWDSVDFINGTIIVENVIERAKVDGAYVEFDSTPKTEGSQRTIHMNPEIARILADYKAQVAATISDMPEDERPDIGSLYVIGNTRGGHYSPHRLGVNLKKWSKVRNIIGTEGEVIGYHDLRHTWATLSLKAHPEQIAEISAMLGHSNIATTLGLYVGKDADAQKTFMNSMTDLFSARVPEDVAMLHTGTNG